MRVETGWMRGSVVGFRGCRGEVGVGSRTECDKQLLEGRETKEEATGRMF